MHNGNCKRDMSHAFASHTFLSDFDAAPIADDSLISDPLILTAMAFPIADRAEDFFTEQSVLFRPERSVINRLGFCYFPMRAGKNQIRRRQCNSNLRKSFLYDILM